MKYLDIGNELYLRVMFCETGKKPITKIKCSTRLSNPELCPIPYPYQSAEEEYLYFMVNMNSKVVIRDVEMVEIKLDNEPELEENMEIVRLPNACQKN